MRVRPTLISLAALATLAGWAATPPAHARADIVSYAFVNDDATLSVRNKTIRLFGIYVPPTERICRRQIQPVRCASRAALALDFKIQGFVHCDVVSRHRDGSITARCANDGEDLSEYLLSQGWALALPDAPFAYHALERIARVRGLGVWGFPADRITEPGL